MTRWIIALALVVHGVGHIVFFFAAFTPVPMDFVAAPWLLPGAFTIDSPVGKAFAVLWLLAMIGFVGAAIGLIAKRAWWPTIAVAAAVVSLVVILPWWNTINASTRFWATAADVVIILAFAMPWRDQVIAALA
jgi:hypothetical protein